MSGQPFLYKTFSALVILFFWGQNRLLVQYERSLTYSDRRQNKKKTYVKCIRKLTS